MAIKTYYLLKRYIDNVDRTIPFYIEGLTSNFNALLSPRYGDATNIEYSTDRINWTAATGSGTTPNLQYSIPVQANTKTYIRANSTVWGTASSSSNLYTGLKNCNVGGNIMSLFYGSTFTGAETAFPDPTKTFILANFFANGGQYLTSISDLVLPVKTLTNYCYSQMFRGCTALTVAPELPATTLADYCYSQMFNGCTALTDAPALPATTLASNCYQDMFSGCTSLTAAPALPATTLAQNCYFSMFYNCSSLNSITVGATSWNISAAYGWVSGVSATGTFTKPSGTTIPEGTNGIPSGWTVVNV